MYVGRFIVIGPDFGAYRVSSRSFPNRRVVERDGTLTVSPTPDAPETDNPYISYNCVREGGDGVVVGNGSHVDPIAEKLDLGYPARDALAESLLAMDYEKDDYDTPRIAGVVGEQSYIGIVRKDALLVRPVEDDPMLVATYEQADPGAVTFDGSGSPAEIAERAYEMEYEHAVCAAGVTYDDGDADVGFYNGE
ncbi:IMP cyclohydrolase [Halogeometricum limi]|uniref:IMP cyclohydrolase n=1 Tax=Halogeometricum limi TaxID=555875 RepID=A0A1I6FR18_9EURY|nr:IMP cyclohydrolase [Halogeometricum limi]SFR32402.1 IMP cyclohydrolase [Halogeometricum limi]